MAQLSLIALRWLIYQRLTSLVLSHLFFISIHFKLQTLWMCHEAKLLFDQMCAVWVIYYLRYCRRSLFLIYPHDRQSIPICFIEISRNENKNMCNCTYRAIHRIFSRRNNNNMLHKDKLCPMLHTINSCSLVYTRCGHELNDFSRRNSLTQH